MSWFSLIRAEKKVLDSQQFFKSTLTGQFIGEYTVNGVLKKNQTYLRIKEAVASFFTEKLCIPLDKITAELSDKLLEKVIYGKNFPEMFPELFSHCHGKAKDHDFKEACRSCSGKKTPEPTASWMTHLTDHIFKKFLESNNNAYDKWIKAFDKGEEALQKIGKKAIVSGLKPFFKKAAKASSKVLVKRGVENAYDGMWSSGISIVSLAVIYRTALFAFNCAAETCKDTFLNRTFNFIQNYLPAPYTTLTVLTALHIAEMVHVYWKARKLHLKNTDLNKGQVKTFVISITKDPMKRALQEKTIYKIMNMTFTEDKVDNFIELLVNEVIDNHWDQLHQIRFLNLPLVT